MPTGPTWEPQPHDFARVFAEQNPWRKTGKVPASLAFDVERPLARSMHRVLVQDAPRRFQLVLGPRRVGKTVGMYQTVRHLLREGLPPQRLWWLHMAHPLLMDVPLDQLVNAAVDSAQATDRSPAYLFIDELTYARDWDLWLKTLYDERRPVRIMATSSAAAALRQGGVESGVGRWDEQFLSPYLFDEFLELIGRTVETPSRDSLAETLVAVSEQTEPADDLSELRLRFLLTGGFPELLNTPEPEGMDAGDLLLRSQRVLRKDVVERVVYKDIPQVYKIESPLNLERLLYVLAGQFTGILGPGSICNDLSMSQPTFDRYLSYLERSFVVFTLQNYAKTEAGRQRRGRKLYFTDGSVRNAALQRGLAPLDDAQEMGHLLENLFAAHLYALGLQTGVRVHHWRSGSDEVDLIYDHPSAPVALEIASSAGHQRRGLVRFQEQHPRFAGHCYLVAPNARPLHPAESLDGVGVLPLDAALLAVAVQTRRSLAKRLGEVPATLF